MGNAVLIAGIQEKEEAKVRKLLVVQMGILLVQQENLEKAEIQQEVMQVEEVVDGLAVLRLIMKMVAVAGQVMFIRKTPSEFQIIN